MSLQERMIFYRARENISQKELARRCGVTPQTITNVERGIQTPSRLTEAKIDLVVNGDGKDEA